MSIFHCMKRRAYPSEAAAQSVIYNMRARKQDVERLKPELCQYCYKWHLKRVPRGVVA